MGKRSRDDFLSERRRLERAAKAMGLAAEQGRSVLPVLKRCCPDVYRQIRRDRKAPALLSLWGRCVNVDEHAKQVIVSRAIAQGIEKLAGLGNRGRHPHAGLQHTYGYLFSLIETPHGFKRDRWLSPGIARGFGLERSLLSSRPREGTLLANLTWFLGRIVYGDDPRYATRMRRNAPAVAAGVIDYDYGHLTRTRVVERVVLPGAGNREVSLYTDLVAYPHQSARPGSTNTLLVHSVQNGRSAPVRLITAFPVGPVAVNEIMASVPPKGATVEVRLRYNAHVPGMKSPVLGYRWCSEAPLRTE